MMIKLRPVVGYNDVPNDAKMGWSRYIHSMQVFVSTLAYATFGQPGLLDRIAYRLGHSDGRDQAIFNEVNNPSYAYVQMCLCSTGSSDF